MMFNSFCHLCLFTGKFHSLIFKVIADKGGFTSFILFSIHLTSFHFSIVVQQNPTQRCKANLLQLKRKKGFSFLITCITIFFCVQLVIFGSETFKFFSHVLLCIFYTICAQREDYM